MKQIWVVDDDSSLRWVLTKALQDAGFLVVGFSRADEVLERITKEKPDAIMTDIRMPGISGLELAQSISQRHEEIPCIVMTAHTDLDSALASYKHGAFEYLPKPFDLDKAVQLAKRATRDQSSIEEGEIVADAGGGTEMIGSAPAMQDVFRAIGRLASSNMNVLISGPSGTGKELVASALHRTSPRKSKSFVAINISAIPADLLESELFGHEKGSFTGAQSRRQGRFEQAHEGTLFLDEIGEMSADLQSRLLRVLSDKRFYRVGGGDLISVDVRVLAATNRNLQDQVRKGEFREDLYHRLKVIQIELPPLKDRCEDIPLLAKRFLSDCAKELAVEQKILTTEALDSMMRYTWPGNVRELENTCRWITVMAPAQHVGAEDLPKELSDDFDQPSTLDWQSQLRKEVKLKLKLGEPALATKLLKQLEGVLIECALQHCDGHKQNAAKALGWGRNTISRKIKERS